MPPVFILPKFLCETTPLHCVCQAFQTVPIWFSAAAVTASKLPSTLITSSGAISVSNHSSADGASSIRPTHEEVRKGVTLSVVVA